MTGNVPSAKGPMASAWLSGAVTTRVVSWLLKGKVSSSEVAGPAKASPRISAIPATGLGEGRSILIPSGHLNCA